MADLSMEKLKELQDQFSKFDRNKDGTLDVGEMSVLLKRGNPDLTDADLRTLFSSLDANKDGKVDFTEFVVYVFSQQAGEQKEAPDQVCARPGCQYLVHPELNIGFCCSACRACGQHGPRCQKRHPEVKQPGTAALRPAPAAALGGRPYAGGLQEYLVFEHKATIVLDGSGKPGAPKLNSWALPHDNHPYTVSLWVKLHGGSGAILYWGTTGFLGSAIGLHMDNPTTLCHFWWEKEVRAKEMPFGDQQWHHVAATYDGQERRLYVDYQLRAHDRPGVTSRVSRGDNLTVGYVDSTQFGENACCFKGELKDIRIYDCSVRYEGNRPAVVPTDLRPEKMNVAEQDGETEEMIKARCESLKESYVERKEHFEEPSGFLITLLQTRAVALVKGSYIIDLAKRGGRLPHRQAAPPEAFWSPREAIALFRRSLTEHKKDCGHDKVGVRLLGLFLVAASYGWCSKDGTHADPDGFHLRRLAKILECLAKLRKQYGTFEDVGVFFDFVSMFQTPPGGGKKTKSEKELFSLGLFGMNYIYSHDLVLVIRLKLMPPCPHPQDEEGYFEIETDKGERKKKGWEYHHRGWPTFEQIISDSRLAVHWSRLEFPGEDVTFDTIFGVQKYVSQGAPCQPTRFMKALENCPFTNGSDLETVLDCYFRTFRCIVQTREQNIVSVRWSREVCERYADVLWAFSDLEHFLIAASSIGQSERGSSAVCLRMLTTPLAAKKLLKRLCYQDMAADDAAVGIICESLPPGLEMLNFHNHLITDEGIRTLAKWLPKKTPNLKMLHLTRMNEGWFAVTESSKQVLRKALPSVDIKL